MVQGNQVCGLDMVSVFKKQVKSWYFTINTNSINSVVFLIGLISSSNNGSFVAFIIVLTGLWSSTHLKLYNLYSGLPPQKYRATFCGLLLLPCLWYNKKLTILKKGVCYDRDSQTAERCYFSKVLNCKKQSILTCQWRTCQSSAKAFAGAEVVASYTQKREQLW